MMRHTLLHSTGRCWTASSARGICSLTRSPQFNGQVRIGTELGLGTAGATASPSPAHWHYAEASSLRGSRSQQRRRNAVCFVASVAEPAAPSSSSQEVGWVVLARHVAQALQLARAAA